MIYISDIYTTAPTDDRVATEKKVYQILDKLKISYERVDNDVVETMEECEEIDKALGTEIRKSIFFPLFSILQIIIYHISTIFIAI